MDRNVPSKTTLHNTYGNRTHPLRLTQAIWHQTISRHDKQHTTHQSIIHLHSSASVRNVSFIYTRKVLTLTKQSALQISYTQSLDPILTIYCIETTCRSYAHPEYLGFTHPRAQIHTPETHRRCRIIVISIWLYSSRCKSPTNRHTNNQYTNQATHKISMNLKQCYAYTYTHTHATFRMSHSRNHSPAIYSQTSRRRKNRKKRRRRWEMRSGEVGKVQAHSLFKTNYHRMQCIIR